MRHSLLIHTTDPEFYLILRYILEEAGHIVDLVSNLDVLLHAAPPADDKGNTILLCLAANDLLRTSSLIRKERPDLRIVGFPLGNKPIDKENLGFFDHLATLTGFPYGGNRERVLPGHISAAIWARARSSQHLWERVLVPPVEC